VSEIRKYKHDTGLALNAPMGKVTIYAPHTVRDEGDISRTLNADVHWRTDTARLERVITDIEFDRAVVGPVFRRQAQAFMTAVKALPHDTLVHPPKTINLEGNEVEIPKNAFTPKFSYLEEGEKVDVISVGDVIVTIAKTA
jgi:valyl-tRNA synthetase